MSSDRRIAIIAASSALLLGTLLALFSANPLPATFADDSASYLLQAMALNPFQETDSSIVEAAKARNLPVLFSWLLAVSGAADDLLRAHLLVSGIHALSMLTFWALVRARFKVTDAEALFLTCLAIATPGFWVGSLGILSESTYALLSFLALWRIPPTSKTTDWTSLAFLGAFTLLALMTRSIGIALLIAWSAWLLSHRAPVRQWIAPVTVLALFVSMQLLQKSQVGAYAEEGLRPILEKTFLGADNGSVDLKTVVMANLGQISVAWRENLLGAALIGHFLPSIIALMVGSMALLGIGLGIRERRFDSFYLLAYLLILVLWPYPEQQFRFLMPVMPLLLVNAWQAVRGFGVPVGRQAKTRALAISLAVIVAANLFSIQLRRLTLPTEERALGYITDYYREPNPGAAWLHAKTFVRAMEAMTAAAAVLPAGSVTLSARESFFTLLSGHASMKLLGPEQMDSQLCEIIADQVTHIFLSPVTSYWNQEGLAAAERFSPYVSAQLDLGPLHRKTSRLFELDRQSIADDIERRAVECKAQTS